MRISRSHPAGEATYFKVFLNNLKKTSIGLPTAAYLPYSRDALIDIAEN